MEALRTPAQAIDTPGGARPGFGRSRRFLSALSDARLVERMRRGNDLAFEVAYDRYSAQLLSFCRHLLGSREEAEDALQHTFMSAYRELTEGERAINLRPWLYTIARNRCISIIRARHEQPHDDLEISTAGLSQEVEQREDLREMLRDLQDLPADQRAALILAEIGDLSHPEIAQVVGCSPPKVKALVFQARSALMQRRLARETPCRDVQAQLAAERGQAARRGVVRKHMAACPACTEFYEGVRGQRERLAALLPVIPAAGLKEQALAAVGASGGSNAGGGLIALVTGESVARYAVVGTLVGGGVLAVGAAVTGVAPAIGGPDEERTRPAERAAKPAPPRSRPPVMAPGYVTTLRQGELDSGAGAKRRADAISDPRERRARSEEDKPRKRRRGSRDEDAPQTDTGGRQGASSTHNDGNTPRRTRRRPNGGGPSPNANPNAGPPKAPDHPGSTHGNAGTPPGNANGHSDGRGPNG